MIPTSRRPNKLPWSINAFLLSGNLPRELWQMPPQNVTIIPNRETFISGFVFRPNGASGRGDGMPFDAARVSHTKLPHPRDSWYGMGKIQASIMTYEIDNAAHLFSWKFFEQGDRKSTRL